MSRDAAAGAISRKSSAIVLLSLARWISINPPPARFPALGRVTAKANPVATAASTALPPKAKISAPIRLATTS